MAKQRSIIYRDNKGGCNLLSNEANINQSPENTEMLYLQNVDIYKEGGFSCQLGNMQLNQAITDATAVTGIGQYRKGADTFIVYTKASGSAYVLPAGGGNEAAAVKTGLSVSAVPKFVEYNSKVIAFNGVDQPWSWNGTTAANLTGTPAGWSSLKPTTADTDGGRRIFAVAGSTIYYCALGNENDWTTASDAGSLSNVFNDNTNIINVSNYGDRVAFHSGKPGIYLLSGTSPATYAINPIASNRACISKLGVATCADQQYFFSGDAILPIITTDLGVIRLGKNFDISRKIKPFITGTDSEMPLLPMDQSTRNATILLPYDFKNQLIGFFKSVGSSTLDTQGIFNLDTGAWTFRKATPATAAARVGDNIVIGTADGRIVQEFVGSTLVAGSFQKRILSPYFDFGTPNNQKSIGRFYMVCKSNTDLTLVFNFYTDYQSSRKYTHIETGTGISGSSYGSAMYGVSTYSTTQFFDIRLEQMNIDFKRIQFEVLNTESSQDFRIIYYSFDIQDQDAY